MEINQFLGHFKNVKTRASDRWMASCPGHPDKAASLSIKNNPDGRILLYCFGGCDSGAVLEAIGLSLSDLFPDRDRMSKGDKPIRGEGARNYADLNNLLSEVKEDLAAISIVASLLAQGETLSYEDRDRMALAALRIYEIIERITI